MMLKSLVLLSLSAASVSARSFRTSGCFDDAGSLKDQGTYTYQNYAYCVQTCQQGDFSIAALTDGDRCYCGNELPPSSAKVDDGKCNVKCSGWPQDTCGGSETFSVIDINNQGISSSDSEYSGTTAVSVPSTMATSILKATDSASASSASTAAAEPTTTKIPTTILTAPSMGSQSGAGGIVIASSSPIASKAAGAASSSGAAATPSPSNGAAGRSVQVGSGVVAAMLPLVAALL
ncbi:hypothetical protein ASPWEDRAFT_29301 [Aspergillus wentii DTO 134E9]|uniref:WSC domain-containing protein n=1 Tax=Aspergillus wentii DTO 134E9 TaxID=1073089 RepID=A0A1L9RGT1_ASPWE|nr:uncharacterized protein ASPWEDRAFT_29301 [Aspergillus wentii DTO 134E9]KAI9927909.1 hypothetical protein MW887_002761 [Aspergillus wentii]OJJ34132.1 hypothetical protein ASPWEDRAFT_29301 [Aspergillus wentii DTO 134E9]